jgi:hypothetical protein
MPCRGCAEKEREIVAGELLLMEKDPKPHRATDDVADASGRNTRYFYPLHFKSI